MLHLPCDLIFILICFNDTSTCFDQSAHFGRATLVLFQLGVFLQSPVQFLILQKRHILKGFQTSGSALACHVPPTGSGNRYWKGFNLHQKTSRVYRHSKQLQVWPEPRGTFKQIAALRVSSRMAPFTSFLEPFSHAEKMSSRFEARQTLPPNRSFVASFRGLEWFDVFKFDGKQASAVKPCWNMLKPHRLIVGNWLKICPCLMFLSGWNPIGDHWREGALWWTNMGLGNPPNQWLNVRRPSYCHVTSVQWPGRKIGQQWPVEDTLGRKVDMKQLECAKANETIQSQ